MTKTSLLFAQKKTEAEVQEWENKWMSYKNQFINIKKSFDKFRNKEVSEKQKPKFLASLKSYLADLYNSDDDSLPPAELKEKYEDDIKQVDSDWWIFSKICIDFDYPIFMAHAEEIGYKRGANKEEPRNNELFSSIEHNGHLTINIDTNHPASILDNLIKNLEWK